jgi:penicillin-binding protein 1C
MNGVLNSIKKAASILVILAGIVALILAADYHFNMPQIPDFEKVRASCQASEARLYDRNGELIHEMRINDKERRLDWVEARSISDAMKKTVIAAEDKRFYSHSGVDWIAVCHSIITLGSRGASTITMQTAGFVNPDCRKIPRGISAKWRQMKSAAAMEDSWTKKQILEAYLNLASFRGELMGIGSASEGLLGKEPSGINTQEALVLSAMLPGNARSPEILATRAQRIATSMDYQVNARMLKNAAADLMIKPYHIRPAVSLAPHAARMFLKKGRHQARCTLDKRIQTFAADSLNSRIQELKGRNVNDGAVIVIDNKTGEILAYVASNFETSPSRNVDGIISQRQAGSTLKPFLYALAIEKKYITAASVIEDSPLKITTDAGVYIPENYNSAYRGHVSARTALASSLNIPAVRVLKLTGVDSFLLRLKDSGFSTLNENSDFYGYSLALGSADIRLIDLAAAYMAIANAGLFRHPTMVPGVKSHFTNHIMDKNTAFIITDILSDRQARSLTFGFENPLSTSFFTAVKTGTSKDMRDNWCVGFSQRYTVGVWVGNFSGKPMWNVSGITGAAFVWMDIMKHLNSNQPSIKSEVPPGIINQKISYAGNIEPARSELFIEGTEPLMMISIAGNHLKPSIIYPVQNSIISIDPDIPTTNQKVLFRANNIAGYRWKLNGRYIGSSPAVFWKPSQGKHRLVLVDKANVEAAGIDFTVR